MKIAHVLLLTSLVMVAACQPSTSNQDQTSDILKDTVTFAGFNADLVLPPPDEDASTKNYCTVIGWGASQTPNVPAGMTIKRFAQGIKSPRNLIVAPNGDIFVAFANTESKKIKKKISDKLSGRENSQPTDESLNKIYLFRDTNGDGQPELQIPFLEELKQPFGMVILGNYFYVANTDGLYRYPYKEGDTTITVKGEKLVTLPAGGYNNHWTRNLLASKDGSTIYISVGSASDHGEHGMKEEEQRACILEVRPDGTGLAVFASGLRNPVGMDFNPDTNELYTVVNERDNLGDDLVPDYLTRVQRGGFYGWPYSYFGDHRDPRIKEEDQKPELIAKTIVPDLPLDAHSSSMGLVFYKHNRLPAYHGSAFVTQRGSWNRTEFTGYRIAFVPFHQGKIAGPAETFIDGFIADARKGEVYGRPVATAVTKEGNLLITDDVSNTIWFVAPAKQ